MTKEILQRLIADLPDATEDELDRLYTNALREDPNAAEIVARQIFDEMKTFDPDRTAAMVQLMTDGDPAGDDVCKALLKDMRKH